jgi:hypothetical protein
MSTAFPPFGPETLPRAQRTAVRTPRWLREPLLHFVLLGGLLFAIDYFIAGRADDPRTIVVDQSVDAEALQVFREARGREPTQDELYALRRVWLDNEVLYREGLALQMDEGDPAIRDKVIFKALSVINAGLKLPPHDDATLRRWFEQNRDKYDEPARFDFLEAVLVGENSEDAARQFASALNAGTPGEAQAGLRVFDDRPRPNLVTSYGEEFARELESAQSGEWRAMPTSGGWVVMRLDVITPPKPADFEALRGVVLQDWTDAVMAEQRTAAVRALARKYTVKVESAGP